MVQGHLVVVLLQHIESSSKNLKSLSFRLNSRSMELNPEDFALITGLKYGTVPQVDCSASNFHNTMFLSRRSIKLSNIHNKFVVEGTRDGNSVDALKLGLFYVVYGFLLVRDKYTNYIDLKYLHLVDDLESFVKFPWGELLMISLLIKCIEPLQ